MIITIIIADNVKIANHYLDADAIYVEDLKINNLTAKKGVTIDTFKFSLDKQILDSLQESFMYLCYNTKIELFLSSKKIFTGFIDKIQISEKNLVSFDAYSNLKYQGSQYVVPNIATLCQSQVYSESCALKASEHSFNFDACSLDCFTGKFTVDIDHTNQSISLGGSASTTSSEVADGNAVLFDGNAMLVVCEDILNNSLFLDLANWWGAYVVINNKYRANVVNVTEDGIYISMNYTDQITLTSSVKVYLKCDKTYGNCFSRFNNTQNFWGFANNGRRLATFDIFSATSLEYCGEELADTDFELCNTDFNLFGVNLYD